MSQKLIEVKHRMRSIDNIRNITQTIATVAAAKLARTRTKAAGLQTYSRKMREIILDQSTHVQESGEELGKYSPLLRGKEKVEKVGLFVIASDVGMCGNYNGRINRLAHKFAQDKLAKNQQVFLITKGLKAEEYFRKKTKLPIIHKYTWRSEGVSLADAEEVLNLMLNFYERATVDQVDIAYTQFYSAVKSEPKVLKLLPLSLGVGEKAEGPRLESWIYEPNRALILEELVPTYLRIQVYDILLESYASEQAARMMAMEEATDRAEKTLRALLAQYNKMRRELVTLDLLGIISAGKVLEKEATSQMGF